MERVRELWGCPFDTETLGKSGDIGTAVTQPLMTAFSVITILKIVLARLF